MLQRQKCRLQPACMYICHIRKIISLPLLTQHKTQTQARHYRVHDKVRDTDLGHRAVNKLVSLKTANIHEAHLDRKEEITGKPWSVEETEQLKRLFSEDIETGAIEEPKVTEKLSS